MRAALGRRAVQQIDQGQHHENGAGIGNLPLQVAPLGCVGLHRLGEAITGTRISLTRLARHWSPRKPGFPGLQLPRYCTSE